MTIREMTEQIERETLSERAMLSVNTRGREQWTEPCPIRTDFQRDRDRIIHCNAFRRLKHKTQVFLSPEGDHYRTRLTHTLEVSQIARTIARALRLNEDLTEAVTLGHDLGHTPFGHVGERALAELCGEGFTHYRQSVRVLERLERDGQGLNLTHEVRNGIACHTTGPEADTLEGRIVRIADKIAYLNHDIDDAVRAKVLEENMVPFDVQYVLGRTKSQRITALVSSVITHTTDEVRMDAITEKAYQALTDFMFDFVYTNPIAKGEEGKAKDLVQKLFVYYTANPDKLPPDMRQIAEAEGVERAACDYISGMSDRYAVMVYEDLFIPKSWGMI